MQCRQVCLGALAESLTYPLDELYALGRVDQVGIQRSKDRSHSQSAALEVPG